MLIYILLLAVIILGFLLTKKNNWVSLQMYFVLVCIGMILIVGLRSISLGIVDTEFIYVPRIKQYFAEGFSYIFLKQKKDVTFYIMTKFFSTIYQNENFVLFIIGIPYLISVTRLIKKYSKIPWLSFVLFLGLQYFMLSFFLLRQVVAMAFTIIAFDFIDQKKPIKFVLCVLIASLFHQTALIFLLAYPITKLKPGKKQWIIVAAGFAASLALRSSVMSWIFTILSIIIEDTSRYTQYLTRESSLGYTGFLIQLLVFIFVSILYKRQTERYNRVSLRGTKIVIWKQKIRVNENAMMAFDDRMDRLYNMSTISLAIVALSVVLGEFYRVAGYFGIFNIILLSNAIFLIKNKSLRLWTSSGVAFVLILYFLFIHLGNVNGVPYKFFWQG